MAIYGDNDVYANSPVAAYSVGTRNGGIISGGTGDEATVTQGVNFKWVYDPNDSAGSGFTGNGWFADTLGSPIWCSIQYYGMTLQGILDEFAVGTRTNLNDVFKNWQNYVDLEGSQDNDVLQQFQRLVGYDCWSNLT